MGTQEYFIGFALIFIITSADAYLNRKIIKTSLKQFFTEQLILLIAWSLGFLVIKLTF